MESASPVEEDVLSSDTCVQSMSGDDGGEEKIETGPRPITSRRTRPVVRFSAAQLSYLNTYYQNGMTGIAKRHSLLIQQAAKETQLTTNQVKVHC